MSHEITEVDGLVLTGEPAWHGLGIVVKDAPTPAEALRIAGLGWNVEQSRIEYVREALTVGDDGIPVKTETRHPCETDVVNVRSDTGEPLGVVGKNYGVVQNRDLVALVVAAAGQEDVEIESAG